MEISVEWRERWSLKGDNEGQIGAQRLHEDRRRKGMCDILSAHLSRRAHHCPGVWFHSYA